MTIFMSAGSLPTTLAALMRAARGGNILEVDTTEAGGNTSNRIDDFLVIQSVQSVQTDRPGIGSCVFLE
jgi:hypothetical protein